MPRKGRRSRNRMKRGSNVRNNTTLAYRGPTAGPNPMLPNQPPPYVANLVITKVFRFVLAANQPEGTSYQISAAKLCALISVATTTTNVVQYFEAVQVKWIRLWSSVSQTSGLFTPKTVSVEFSGTAAGILGPQAKASDMSVGATRNARIMVRPPRNSQAAQWQSGSTLSSPSLFFTVTAGGGAVLDIALNLTVTGDARAANSMNTTVTGPATVGTVYWLSLDNNAGGNLSTGDEWSPMPELITIN